MLVQHCSKHWLCPPTNLGIKNKHNWEDLCDYYYYFFLRFIPYNFYISTLILEIRNDDLMVVCKCSLDEVVHDFIQWSKITCEVGSTHNKDKSYLSCFPQGPNSTSSYASIYGWLLSGPAFWFRVSAKEGKGKTSGAATLTSRASSSWCRWEHTSRWLLLRVYSMWPGLVFESFKEEGMFNNKVSANLVGKHQSLFKQDRKHLDAPETGIFYAS